jgi:hypothetical protein
MTNVTLTLMYMLMCCDQCYININVHTHCDQYYININVRTDVL